MKFHPTHTADKRAFHSSRKTRFRLCPSSGHKKRRRPLERHTHFQSIYLYTYMPPCHDKSFPLYKHIGSRKLFCKFSHTKKDHRKNTIA